VHETDLEGEIQLVTFCSWAYIYNGGLPYYCSPARVGDVARITYTEGDGVDGPHEEVSEDWQEIEHLTDTLAVHLPRPTAAVFFPRASLVVPMVPVPPAPVSMPVMVPLFIILRGGRGSYWPQGEPGAGVVGE
jgi:hypothetical protein